MLTALLVLATWTSSGCSSPAPHRPPPASSSSTLAAESGTVTLVRRADEAFTATLRPDYEQPHQDKPHGLEWVSALYLEACRAGDRRSCWLADSTHQSEATTAIMRRGCLAGDRLSCRALPENNGDEPDRGLPGWAGRSRYCFHTECVEIMRQECEAGFPRSCWRVSDVEDEAMVGAEAIERAIGLALDACRAGVLEECYSLSALTKRGFKAIWAFEQICNLSANCSAGDRIHSDQPLRARAALERGCQYGRGDEQELACMRLILGYLQGVYPEPVPGRARALAEWYCRNSGSFCVDAFLEQGPSVGPL